MEEQVKENERTIRVLANAIPDAVMLLDHNRQIIALNDAMARRLGYNYYSDVHPDPSVQFDQNGMFTSVESQVEEILRLRPACPLRGEERG